METGTDKKLMCRGNSCSHTNKALDPLIKIGYLATYNIVRNLLYQLTSYDSYNHVLVKKEVLAMAERNDE